jgi:hypothetical protein
MSVLAEVARLEAAYPNEFRDGFKCGIGVNVQGARDPGGYPAGFRNWDLNRRNAWFAGANRGLVAKKGGQP